MLSPKEKAQKLVVKFKQYSYYDAHDLTTRVKREESNTDSAIECALIAVDDILKVLYKLSDCSDLVVEDRDYYEEVKQELEKL